MGQIKDFNLSEKIKEMGIGNVLLIAVFLICLIYFVIYSIVFYGNKIFNNDVNIYYDYENSEEYAIDSSNEFYKTELVTDSSTFYNIEDIINVIFSNIKNQKYSEVANIFSNSAKRNLDLSEKQVVEKLQEFNNTFLINEVQYKLSAVYHLNETDIYLCSIKNANGEEKEVVLNIDFNELTYKIEDFEF